MLLRSSTGASEDTANPAQLEAFLQIPRNAFFKTSGVWDITPNENFCKVQCLVHWRTSRLSRKKIFLQLKSTSTWTHSTAAEVTVATQGGRGMTLWGSWPSLCPDTPSSSQGLQQIHPHFERAYISGGRRLNETCLQKPHASWRKG